MSLLCKYMLFVVNETQRNQTKYLIKNQKNFIIFIFSFLHLICFLPIHFLCFLFCSNPIIAYHGNAFRRKLLWAYVIDLFIDWSITPFFLLCISFILLLFTLRLLLLRSLLFSLNQLLFFIIHNFLLIFFFFRHTLTFMW